MSKEVEQKISQLQLIEQNLQNYLMQKQNLQNQLIEIESAQKELETAKKAYKIVGNIMVSSAKEDLVKDLNEKKKIVELRIKNLEKQEDKIKKKAEELKKDVLSNMKE